MEPWTNEHKGGRNIADHFLAYSIFIGLNTMINWLVKKFRFPFALVPLLSTIHHLTLRLYQICISSAGYSSCYINGQIGDIKSTCKVKLVVLKCKLCVFVQQICRYVCMLISHGHTEDFLWRIRCNVHVCIWIGVSCSDAYWAYSKDDAV